MMMDVQARAGRIDIVCMAYGVGMPCACERVGKLRARLRVRIVCVTCEDVDENFLFRASFTGRPLVEWRRRLEGRAEQVRLRLHVALTRHALHA